MTLTEPAGITAPDPDTSPRSPGRTRYGAARPVSAAIDAGAVALYAAAMPRGAAPWERHSHTFQGIYLERTWVVLAAALDVDHLANLHAAHAREVVITGDIACACGQVFDEESEFYAHQARALRAWALGDAS